MNDTPTRPLLRYHGGKWLLAPWIISHFPSHLVYVEPFGGAASVLLRKPRSRGEVYNDLDGDVVALFRVLRDPFAALALADCLRLTPYSREEWRAAHESATTDLERARRIIVRSYQTFGTTTRTLGRSGFRATPWRCEGSTAVADWARYPEAIPAFVERLRGVLIEQRHAIEVIEQQDAPSTLFYVDPPYPLGTRTSVASACDADRGYAHNLSDGDHRLLADALRKVKGFVVLSGYACELYDRELFADWHRVERDTKADGARDRTEVLWLSPRTAESLAGRQERMVL